MDLPKKLSWYSTALEAIQGVDLSGESPHQLRRTIAGHPHTIKGSRVCNVCQSIISVGSGVVRAREDVPQERHP